MHDAEASFAGECGGGGYRSRSLQVNTSGPRVGSFRIHALAHGCLGHPEVPSCFHRGAGALQSGVASTKLPRQDDRRDERGILIPNPTAARCSAWARWPGIGWRAGLDLVFPATCVACGRTIDRERGRDLDCGLCDDCVGQLELFAGPACRQCGAPVPGTVDLPEGCIRCRGQRQWFDETVAVGEYLGRLRELLLEMKRARGNAVLLAVARLRLGAAWRPLGIARAGRGAGGADALTAALEPRHEFGGRAGRGIWPAAARAAEVAAAESGRNTPPRVSLPPSKSWQNVRQAFSAKRSYSIQGAHVLLVDDIMTTGATCSEAAHTLKAAGADRVSVVVVARTLTH